MRELGIKARTTGLYAWRPGQHALYSSAGNQLKRAAKPNQKHQIWVGDFTYIKTGAGFIHFAAVMDLFSRKIVGWSFSSKRNAEFTKSALLMALERDAPSKGCLFHSDQGIEYAAHEYRDLVIQAGMRRSMSRRATPLDNAAMESFFHTLKAELVRKRVFRDKIEAVAEIVEYVEFYNHERLHSALSFQSPIEYEKLHA